MVSNSDINIINNHWNILKSKLNVNLDDANKQLPICIGYLNFPRDHWKPSLLLLLHAVLWNHSIRLVLLLWKFCISKFKLIMLNLSFSGSLNFLASSKNESVLTAIDKLDKTTKTSSASIFDFSTLNAKTSYKLYIFVLKITKPYILQLPNMVHEYLQS